VAVLLLVAAILAGVISVTWSASADRVRSAA
jgi:hypothetical protein